MSKEELLLALKDLQRYQMKELQKSLDECITCIHCGNPNWVRDNVKGSWLKLQKKVKEIEKKVVGGT